MTAICIAIHYPIISADEIGLSDTHVVGLAFEQKETKETKNSGRKPDRDQFNVGDSN